MNLHSPSFSLRRSYHVYFSPTGYWLAVIERGAVAVWNIEQRKRVAALKLAKVNSADFSPDEEYIIAKSTRGDLIFWDWKKDIRAAETKENDSQGTRPIHRMWWLHIRWFLEWNICAPRFENTRDHKRRPRCKPGPQHRLQQINRTLSCTEVG